MIIDGKRVILCKIIGYLKCCIGVSILFFFGVGGIGLAFELSDTDLLISEIICFVFTAIGAFVLRDGMRRKRWTKDLKKYLPLLEAVPAITFVELANRLGEAEDTVHKKFEWFIDKKLLKEAYIDPRGKTIFFRKDYERQLQQKMLEEKRAYERQMMQKQVEASKVYVKLLCSCCGGVTKVEKGKGGTCEYCGAPLES